MKKICVFTGSRAEYGLLKPLLEEIQRDKVLKLQLIVSGMHLSREFGLTYKEIEGDGFHINKKIKMRLYSDDSYAISKAIGLAVTEFSRAFNQLKPDVVVILGDRFECFTAAVAATIARIPIVHLHGGEATFGAIDEALRHSITKMSCLHFTATEEYRRRVIQLGEHPIRVFNVGAIGLDNIRELPLKSKNKLAKELPFTFNKHNVLVTYHPVTLEIRTARVQFQNLINVLDHYKDTNIIFTKANADPDGRVINRIIDAYVRKHAKKAVGLTSMGRLNYLSAMQHVDAVIGNSSSGIIEAPSFKIATINIGDRQKGRIRARSVINCRPTQRDIRGALHKALSRRYRRTLMKVKNPYEKSHVAHRITTIIKRFDFSNKELLKKTFFDIPFQYRI